jgi:hypothetical protein
MADIKSPPSNLQSAKALRSAYFCYFLGALVMLTTCWFIWQGIEATEPDSPARSSKIVSGVLLVFLEGCAFSLAGQWLEYSLQLRLLGWSIFGLQIVTMTLSNFSVGSTASKAAAASKDTLAEYKAQGAAAREAAKALQADADSLRKSKHQFKRDEAGKKSDEAARQTAAAAGVAEKMERLQAATVSSPVIDKLGETWYLVLSCVWSAIFEISGIVLMSTAGGLRRKADAGALPVDQQILELLHRVHGAPAVLQAAPQLAIESKPAAPAKQAATPVYSSWTGKGIPLATVGALGALGAVPQTVQAAPIKPAAQAVTPVNVNPPTPVNDYPPAVVAPVNVDPPAPVKKARKARVAHDGAVMDTGVGEHDGYRYRRALAGVKAGTMRPSRDGLFTAVGASPPTAKRYIETMAEAGEIIPNPNGSGWVLAKNCGAA